MLLLLGFLAGAAAIVLPAPDDGLSLLGLSAAKDAAGPRKLWQGCKSCCMDGDKAAPCLDVDACAAKGPKNGKYAFVYSHWLPFRNTKFLNNIRSLQAQAKRHNIDLLMLAMQKHIDRTSPDMLDEIHRSGFKLVPVGWDLPPRMLFTAPNWTVGDESGWCGPMDLIRLHLFELTGYDAVVYYDSDIELQGDVLPMLRCAATGRFLTTTGTISPINVGFMAVRPDPRMTQASVLFAQKANFTWATGWGGGGYKPWDTKFIGAECGQGFVHTLFYKANTNSLARQALKEAGLTPEDIRPAQLDRCIWNYHGDSGCGKAPEDFDCSLVRVHHKPKQATKNACTKRGAAYFE